MILYLNKNLLSFRILDKAGKMSKKTRYNTRHVLMCEIIALPKANYYNLTYSKQPDRQRVSFAGESLLRILLERKLTCQNAEKTYTDRDSDSKLIFFPFQNHVFTTDGCAKSFCGFGFSQISRSSGIFHGIIYISAVV